MTCTTDPEKTPHGLAHICRGLLVTAIALMVCTPAAAVEDRPAPVQSPPGSFSYLAKKAGPSVVNISAVRIMKRPDEAQLPYGKGDPLEELFSRFYRDRTLRGFRQNSLGTGFIISRDGFILTNNHVVEQSEEIKVTLSDKREFSAKIIGRDSLTDLVLIRIETDTPVEPLNLGNSDRLEVGDWVVAIGNPFGLSNTVTAGVVSAMYRKIGLGPYENFIQTDTPINPGNSGGPLLNTNGEVVGITTLIFTQSGGSLGIGFAIPINIAKDMLPRLGRGKVVRGWMGTIIQSITPELRAKLRLKDELGALVSDALPGGPADKAGIRRGDVVVSYGGKEIREAGDLLGLVASSPIGKPVVTEVIRSGNRERYSVVIEEFEEDSELPVAEENRQEFGLVLQQITPELARKYGLPRTGGLLVVEVMVNTAADEAGFEPGDIILEVDQISVRDLIGFGKKVDGYGKGETVLFLVDHSGITLYLTMKIWE